MRTVRKLVKKMRKRKKRRKKKKPVHQVTPIHNLTNTFFRGIYKISKNV